jgi:dolichyl-phosphate-mannose--protein O-mannosyl transferase
MMSLSVVDWLRDTFDTAKRDARTAWNSQSTVERVTTVFLAAMILGGLILRVQGVGAPASFTFDEEPFVRNAHNYAVGLPDTNDHPPFGKMLIGLGMVLFGFNSLGWRFVPLCFGLQTVVLAYWMGRSVFDDRRAGWMAAAFIAADGFFISYSRSGLLDGMMVCLALWGVLAAVTARSWRGVLVSAVFIGLSTSVKWSGLFAVVPAGVALLTMRRTSVPSILWLAAAPIIHLLVWMGAHWLTGQKSDPLSTWDVMVGLYRHHLDLGHFHNELSSSWWGWPILWKPVVVKLSQTGLYSRYSSSVGNLVFWCTVTLTVVALPISALVVAWRTRLKRYWTGLLGPQTTRGALIMALGWFSFFAPWIATGSTRGKYTFSHYYLPCYAFGLIMLAGFAAYLERKRPKWVVDFIGIALIVSIYYAPVWGEFAMSTAAANHRLFLVAWRP